MAVLSLITGGVEIPEGAALLVWGLCGFFGFMLATAVAAFLAEMWAIAKPGAGILPAREFEGMGLPAPRVRP